MRALCVFATFCSALVLHHHPHPAHKPAQHRATPAELAAEERQHRLTPAEWAAAEWHRRPAAAGEEPAHPGRHQAAEARSHPDTDRRLAEGGPVAPAEPAAGAGKQKGFRGDLSIQVLTVDTALGHQRMNRTLDSMPEDSDIKGITQAFKGIFFKDFPSVVDMLDNQRLVPLLSYTTRVGAEKMGLNRHGRGGGEVACALGHYAIWQKAAEATGWTVVLEDDALLQSGWTASMLNHLLDTSHHDVVWLEGRSCPHLTDPGRGRGASRSVHSGYGTAAYALTPTAAAQLVRQYDFGSPVDLWMQKHCNSGCEVTKDHNPSLPLLPFKEGKAQSEIQSPLAGRRRKSSGD